MAIFGPKALVNTFKKNVNFSTFLTFFFYSLEWCFLVVKYRKRHFPSLYCLKKKVEKNGLFWPQKKSLEKWPFLDQNHGLSPLEKCQFYEFLDFLFL